MNPALDTHEVALTAAAMMDGVYQALSNAELPFTDFLDLWKNGCVEFYSEVATIAMRAEARYQECIASDEALSSIGVYAYDVAEVLGMWLAQQVIDGHHPTASESLSEINKLHQAFFELATPPQPAVDVDAARLFFIELCNSVETLSGIEDRILAQLMWLQNAILDKGFITLLEADPCTEAVLQAIGKLSSHWRWSKYVKLER